jgi:hypothetical protein
MKFLDLFPDFSNPGHGEKSHNSSSSGLYADFVPFSSSGPAGHKSQVASLKLQAAIDEA